MNISTRHSSILTQQWVSKSMQVASYIWFILYCSPQSISVFFLAFIIYQLILLLKCNLLEWVMQIPLKKYCLLLLLTWGELCYRLFFSCNVLCFTLPSLSYIELYMCIVSWLIIQFVNLDIFYYFVLGRPCNSADVLPDLAGALKPLSQKQ